MSLRADGRYRCDRCGADVGNGGVEQCAVVADLDPDAVGQLRTLHLCRDHEDDTGRKVPGCAWSRVLTAKALADYNETRTA